MQLSWGVAVVSQIRDSCLGLPDRSGEIQGVVPGPVGPCTAREDIKREPTHVDADLDPRSDEGSIPSASTSATGGQLETSCPPVA